MRDEHLPREYRKKPVTITAMRRTGDNEDALMAWINQNGTNFTLEDASPERAGTLRVFNDSDGQWLIIPMGHWVIRGVANEMYPCEPDVFNRTYEQPAYPSGVANPR